MEKTKLQPVEPIRFPRNIRLDVLTQGDKIEYIYAARKITSGHKSILEVDFFSLKENAIVFRVFISNTDFITQKLMPEPKWLTSQLDKLVYSYPNYNWENLVTLNERSKNTISSFLRPKIKDIATPKKPMTPLDMIRLFQNKVRKGQLKKKHQKIKDRIDSQFVSMDKMPKDINNWIEKYPLWHNQYVFYKRKGKKFTGYCSACKSEVYPDYAKHKLEGVCQLCGRLVTFKAEGISKNTHDTYVFSYIQKGINGCIIHRVFEGYRSYRNGFDKPDIRFYEKRRYTYKDGKYKAYHHGNFKNTREYRWCEGFPVKNKGYYNFTDSGSLYKANLLEAMQGTEWRDCRLDKFAETKVPFDVMDYLILYQKQPEIRFIAESGLNSLIIEVINNYGYEAQLSIKPEVFDILKDNKCFFPLFKEIGVSSDELEMISNFSSKKFIKKDILLKIRKTGLVKDLAPVLQYTSPVKALNYLAKQSNGVRPSKDDLITWSDYLRLAEFLDYDMNSSFVVFPRKLQREHDRVNDEYGEADCLMGDEKIALMAEKVNALFGYENDRFLIRAPKHSKEIKYEGATLRHCVGSYVKDMAKLKTFILFLRDKKDVNKPFYSVEIMGNMVRQCQGYLHADATSEVSAFLEEWKQHLYRKEQKSLAAA